MSDKDKNANKIFINLLKGKKSDKSVIKSKQFDLVWIKVTVLYDWWTLCEIFALT